MGDEEKELWARVYVALIVDFDAEDAAEAAAWAVRKFREWTTSQDSAATYREAPKR